MEKLRRWLLDLMYEEHVKCDSGIESLVDDIEQIIRDINDNRYDDSRWNYIYSILHGI